MTGARALLWAGMLLLLLAAPLTGADTPRHYRLGISPWVPWAPAHVAASLGLWRELGVSVAVVDHVGDDEQRAAVTHRLVDLAIDRIGCLIGQHQAGIDLILLGEVGWSGGQDRFVGRTAAGPARGDAIGVYRDDPAVLGYLDGALRARGLGLGDVQVNLLGPQHLAGDFVRRRLDWLVVHEPFASDVLERGAHLLGTPADQPGALPIGFGGRAEVVRAIPHRDLVLILTGWIHATRWMADPANAVACRAILVERTLVDPQNDTEVTAMRGVISAHDAATLAERNRLDGALHQYVARITTLLTATKRLKRPIPADLIDTTALLEAAR